MIIMIRFLGFRLLPVLFAGILKKHHHIQRRHSNLGHRAMGQVVFLLRPESRGAFWAVVTQIILLNKIIYVCPEVGQAPLIIFITLETIYF